ncbi:hypothetical protein ALQ76_101697 [Pseudomonas syringae pv. atrofaciens]|nr:hypothetical protein ALQ76_101697 [Pseudomonas syringae pv. atrofaciens]
MISFLMVSGVAATRVSPACVSRGTPMCTTNLLRDFLSFVCRPVHYGWCVWFGQSAPPLQQGRGILQAKFAGFNTFCNETIDELQVTL